MKLKLKTHQILLLLTLILTGCSQSHFKQEQASVEEEKQIQYADFSEFPLPDVPDATQDPSAQPEAEKNAKKSEGNPDQPKDKQDPVKPTLIEKKFGIGTVYYIPVYGEKRNCAKDQQAYVKDESDQILTRLCKSEITNCGLQGSCFYIDDKGTRLFAYKKTVEVTVPETKKKVMQYRFRLNNEISKCPQGMGAWKVCLDPYRSIAADPQFHKMGDVVYVPLLKGQKLPNNEIHDGYLVVRDSGHAILGEGRFDFFIGFDNFRGHLFSNLKLNDKKNGTFDYYRVPEDVAQKVREARKYPNVPTSVHENAIPSMMASLSNYKTMGLQSSDIEFFKLKWN